MTYFRSSRVDMNDMASYLGDPGVFSTFADQVVIPKESLYESIGSLSISRALDKADQKLGIKIIRPLKKICHKYLDAGRGAGKVHNAFLKYVIKYRTFKEALSIIETKELPQLKDQILEYYYRVFIIYIELKRYKAAKKTIEIILQQYIKDNILRSHYDVVLSLALMSKISQVSKTQRKEDTHLKRQVQDLIINLKEQKAIFRQSQQADVLVSQRLILLQQYIFGTQLKSQQEVIILTGASDFNKKLFAGIQSQSIQIIQKVKEQIQDSYERIKIDDIKGWPLNSLATMHKINQFEQLSRYDCGQHMLYLNHQLYSEEQLNTMVTDCFQMHEIIKAKQEQEKLKSQIGEHRGLGMRGFGGFGGFGGMGGMF